MCGGGGGRGRRPLHPANVHLMKRNVGHSVSDAEMWATYPVGLPDHDSFRKGPMYCDTSLQGAIHFGVILDTFCTET